jgi:hypothetical protein
VTRDEFLETIWREQIDAFLPGRWIDNSIRTSEKDPRAPFADVGAALKRLLASGAKREDLARVARFAAYEAVFGTLSALDDPDVEDVESLAGLHESLLGADPSGCEGRPE